MAYESVPDAAASGLTTDQRGTGFGRLQGTVDIGAYENQTPVALADGGATDEATAMITGNVLANDTDPDPTDSLSVSGFDDAGTSGIVGNRGDGTFDYDPNGQFEALAVGEAGTDTFGYTMRDSQGATSSATVTVTVNGENDAPVATDDTGVGFTTNESTPFTTGSVLANDTDVDVGDTVSVTGMDTTGTTGQVTDNGDGTFNYDPDGQFDALANGETATDTFTYTISDGNATDTATVSVTVTGISPSDGGDDGGCAPGTGRQLTLVWIIFLGCALLRRSSAAGRA